MSIVIRNRYRQSLVRGVLVCLSMSLDWLTVCRAETKLEYNRDVRPILADRCFRCHGPDSAARQAELRLDRRESVIERRAIVPGQAAASLVIRRITATDNKQMPPTDSGLKLSAAEIELLRRWVDQGAEYQPHWSFIPPRSMKRETSGTQLSPVNWVQNPIDRFVLTELEQRGLRPSAEADRGTLLRRANLALTGLPPTIDELNAFEADDSPQAYECAIDRLLASPRLAERLTLDWLDAARYADTIGHFTDFPRQAWPWRDWVLDAFQRNMPFDQFTIEQLAGDLLPEATLAQKIATGFNRNHMVTDETGVIDEEYRTGYVADRVETTATVWLGLTAGCARCHDHKYDPIAQREYFSMFAYFNNVPEKGLIYKSDNADPVISLITPEHERRLAELRDAREKCEQRWKQIEPAVLTAEAEWQKSAKLPSATDTGLAAHLSFDDTTHDKSSREQPTQLVGNLKYATGLRGSAGQFDATQYVEMAAPPLDTGRPFSLSVWIRPTTASANYIISKLDSIQGQRGFELLWYKTHPRINLVHEQHKSAIELIGSGSFTTGDWHHLVVTYDGSSRAAGVRLFMDAVPQKMLVRRDSLRGSVASDAPWQVAWKRSGLGFEGFLDELRIYERTLSDDEIRDLFWHDLLSGAVAIPIDKRTANQQDRVRSRFLEQTGSDDTRKLISELAEHKRQEADFRHSVPTAAVMQELPTPRDTFVLTRGQYDQPGEKVTAGVPQSLGSARPSGNRLDFARWLMSSDNPLTARVSVNRMWQQMFGEGLVRTPNDFGLQGEPPTHPDLLDWLAVEFVHSGWDTKALLRQIVTSATFRQTSNWPTTDDPENRLLARGPRFRLPAETIRDQALAIGDLLAERIGGPSVKPYQPPGLWEQVSYNAEQVYEQDHGDSLYRRSLYTFWKRQAPPPSLLTLDSPTRETCLVRRQRTNTPLQSLVLLNDVTFVEAARGLATRLLREPNLSTADRLQLGFRLATSRTPTPSELDSLVRLFDAQLAEFRRQPESAWQLLSVGELPVDRNLPEPELAAMTLVANVLLNLDETLTMH